MEMISKSLTIAELDQARDRHTIPDWQRDEVWDLPRKQDLIDSILWGLKLPTFFFTKTGKPGQFEVVDGQQRRAAILAYLDGKFSLPESTMKELGLEQGRFKDLPQDVANRIRNFKIEVVEIYGATEHELREYFLRLQLSMSLSASEKLNAAHGGLRDYARALADHPFFRRRVAFEDTRSAYFDVTSKVVAMALEGLEISTRFKPMLALFERHSGFLPSSPIVQNLDATLDFLERAFPPETRALKERSFVQSVITLASQLVAGGHSDGQEQAFVGFIIGFHNECVRQGKITGAARDPDFVLFNGTKAGKFINDAKVRHEVLVKKLGEQHPALHAALAPYSGSGYWVADRAADSGDTPPLPPSRVVMVTKSATLQEIYERREQFAMPDWRRRQAWGNTLGQKLIDSILRGWKLPKLYVQRAGDKDEVVDGQQHLSAIFAFMGDKLALAPETVKSFGLTGDKFSNLPPETAERFRNFRLGIDEISGAGPSQLKDIFLRLQKGKSLISREKLNAVPSNLRDFSKSIARHEFFQTRLSFRNARFVYFDIVAKAVAIEMRGFGKGWEFSNLKHLFDSEKDFSSASPVARRIEGALDFLVLALPKKTDFREGLFVQSAITLAARFCATGRSAGHEAAFGNFLQEFHAGYQKYKKGEPDADPDYAKFGFAVNRNKRSVAEASYDVLLTKMRQHSPELASVLEACVAAPPVASSEPSPMSVTYVKSPVAPPALQTVARAIVAVKPAVDENLIDVSWLKENCPGLLAALTRKLGRNGALPRQAVEGFFAEVFDDKTRAKHAVAALTEGDIFDASTTNRIKIKPGILVIAGHFLDEVPRPFARPIAAESVRRAANGSETEHHNRAPVAASDRALAVVAPVLTEQERREIKIVDEFVLAAREFKEQPDLLRVASGIVKHRLKGRVKIEAEEIIRLAVKAGYLDPDGKIQFDLRTGKLFTNGAAGVVGHKGQPEGTDKPPRALLLNARTFAKDAAGPGG
jgi:hypothetical protein